MARGYRRPKKQTRPGGYQEVMLAFQSMPEITKRKVLKKIVRDGALSLLRATKMETWRQGIDRTGRYVNGFVMKVTTKKGDDEISAGVQNTGFNSSLWHLLEFGYRYFIPPTSKFALPPERREGQVAARPHLRPALDTVAPQVQGNAQKRIEKMVAKELRKITRLGKRRR